MLEPGQASVVQRQLINRLMRAQIRTSRYDASLAAELIAILDELERDLVRQIADIDATGVTQRAARRRRLDKLLTETRASIRSAHRRMRILSGRELTELLEIEADATARALRGAFGAVEATLGVGVASESVLAAAAEDSVTLGGPLREYWERRSIDVQQAAAREIRIGVGLGETGDEIARRLRGGRRAGVPIRGVMEATRHAARTYARTSVSSILNTARLATYQANQDILTELVHLSMLDSHTTKVCILRSGLRWRSSDLQPIDHGEYFQEPPLHPNCRSTLIPRVIGADPLDVQDGETWFGGLDAGEQNTIIGPGRAGMFRRGEITFSDMVGPDLKPLRLTDLRALVAGD